MRQDEFRLSLRCLAGLLAVSLTLVSGIAAARDHDEGDSVSRAKQALVMVGTTVVAPPVAWINGRPSNPDKVYGTGEAADFVHALEMVLPAGWTIWAPENPEKPDQADGERIPWEGNGLVWPDVIEALARQHGMKIIADVLNQRAVINVGSQEKPRAILILDDEQVESTRGQDAGFRASQPKHPLYRQYAAPARLSPEPLPDTIGRIAWRFVPVGVQVDLSALGVYVNAPVFQWDIDSVAVSPKVALETLMPAGYCLDEAEFPTVKATICTSELPDSGARVNSERESDEPAS